MVIKGRVHKLGDNINTDDIIAAQYLDSQDSEFLGSKCMENLDSDFAKGVKKGDIIVAGENFGCGSSREHAPLAIKGCGIALVIAVSFARIFFRNAINIGLPIIELRDVQEIASGEFLEVNLSKGVLKSLDGAKVYKTKSFPEFLEGIIKRGGLINWVKWRQEVKDSENT